MYDFIAVRVSAGAALRVRNNGSHGGTRHIQRTVDTAILRVHLGVALKHDIIITSDLRRTGQ